MTERCEQGEDSVDDAPAEAVLAALVRCYLHWQPDVRVLGNVRSCDAVRAIREMWARSSPVASAAEVEALRAERDAAIAAFDLLTMRVAEAQGNNVLGPFMIRAITIASLKDRDVISTLSARVAELEGALRKIAGAKTWMGEHGDFGAGYDAAREWAQDIARAALSPTTSTPLSEAPPT